MNCKDPASDRGLEHYSGFYQRQTLDSEPDIHRVKVLRLADSITAVGGGSESLSSCGSRKTPLGLQCVYTLEKKPMLKARLV